MQLQSYTLLNSIFTAILLDTINLVCSQSANSIALLDKKYANETYFYDISYLNSNLNSYDSFQNKFGNRDRNGAYTNKHSCNHIRNIPSTIRSDLKLSYFYQKFTESYGIPVIGSSKVSSNGLRRACYVLRYYLASNSEFKEIFYKRSLRVVVIASTENLLNVPELNLLPSSWSSVRGLSPTVQIPLIVVAEENVQCSNDKLKSEDLLIHQLSYALITLNALSNKLKQKLEEAYQEAKVSVPWKSGFTLIDKKEYFASSIDVFLGSKKDQATFSLDDLKKYDQKIINLIQQIFPCDNIYITKCKSSRETETSQALKIGEQCESENSSNQPSVLSTIASYTYKPINTSTQNNYFETQSTKNTINTSKILTTVSSYSSQTSSSQTKRQKFYTTNQPLENNDAYTTDYKFFSIVKAFNEQASTQPLSSTTRMNFQKIQTTTDWSDNKQTECEDVNENCYLWANKGECNRNKQFMNIECKRSCDFCNEKPSKSTKRNQATTTKVDLSVYENLCRDEFAHCPIFALRGDCKMNPHYMLDKCKRSCNLCGDLVQQKDRIQPTSKKPTIRRPPSNMIYSSSTSDSEREQYPYTEYTVASTKPYQYSSTSYYTDFTSTKLTYTEKPQENRDQVDERNEKIEDAQEDNKLDSCKDLVEYCMDLANRGDCQTNEETMRHYCPRSCKFC